MPGEITRSIPYDVSGDGSTVVGGTWGSESFSWTRDEGMLSLGVSNAYATSSNGNVIVGSIRNLSTLGGLEAFRWTEANGIEGLGYLTYHGSVSHDVSGNGAIVVGGIFVSNPADGYEGFRWTVEEGMTGIGDLPGGIFFSTAYGISADGNTIVGFSSSTNGIEAFRWTEANGIIGLGILPGGYRSVAYSTSADGSVVVGQVRRGTLEHEAFYWRESEGMVGLGGNRSCAWDVSADGNTIVGWQFGGAFIWDSSNGIRLLKNVLENDFGLNLDGWYLVSARGISSDGLTIVGHGINPSGNDEAWIATLPETSNHRPVADAGDDREVYAWIDEIAEVTLDGSDSNDIDGDELSYYWSWMIDDQIYDANGVSPTIELPVGEHVIELIVNDGIEDSEPNEVVITVIEPLEVEVKVTPKAINRQSGLQYVKVKMVLPGDVGIEDVSEEALVLYPGEIEASSQEVVLDDEGRVKVFGSFDKAALMDAVEENGDTEVVVVGRFTSGQRFFGSDIVKVLDSAGYQWEVHTGE